VPRTSFADEETRKALAGAVRSIELRSGAEVLVAVRERSGHYGAALKAAVVAGLLVLTVLVFSPWPFGHVWFVVDPIVFGTLAAFLGHRIAALERLLTPRERRLEAVRCAAAATFVDRGVSLTRRRTGVLVYLALRERVAVAIADHGIHRAVDASAWARALADIDEALGNGRPGTAIAARIGDLSNVLAAVPRQADDVNEMPDEILVS
jgi:putative membrane protein